MCLEGGSHFDEWAHGAGGCQCQARGLASGNRSLNRACLDPAEHIVISSRPVQNPSCFQTRRGQSRALARAYLRQERRVSYAVARVGAEMKIVSAVWQP